MNLLSAGCAVWHLQNEEACPIAVYLCDIFRIDLFPEGIWEYVLKKYEGSQVETGQWGYYNAASDIALKFQMIRKNGNLLIHLPSF